MGLPTDGNSTYALGENLPGLLLAPLAPEAEGAAAAEEADAAISTRTVFRGDTRSADVVRAAGGFRSRGTSTDLRSYAYENTPSIYVGTSTRTRIAQDSIAGRGGGWVYKIEAPIDQGIYVNKEMGGLWYQNWMEKEWAYPGGIPSEWIVAVRPSWYAWRGPWKPF